MRVGTTRSVHRDPARRLKSVYCSIAPRTPYRALFEFEAYRWMTLRLAKLAIATWVVMAMVKLVWFIQGS